MVLPLHDNGWVLGKASEADIDEVMRWFPDAASVRTWGGPGFRYPFTRDTFREDCHLAELDSYALHNGSGALAAFGQSYERNGRGHLARLVTNPALRRRGAGRQLIQLIIEALAATHGYDEYSLFVYRDNIAAYRCYRSLGFTVREYPPGAPLSDECFFLTRQERADLNDT
jgi:ribosomal protein S18 acetylase RimI-like enzyme